MYDKNLNPETIKTQIAVIGGGAAGLCAAVAAAEKGADIILLEKHSKLGGNSAMAFGPFAAESPAQKRALVAATLLAVNASEFFTQDVEDYIVNDFEAIPPVPAKPKPKSTPAQPAVGFPTIVAEVNAELGAERYNVYHAQNAIKKVIDDFK